MNVYKTIVEFPNFEASDLGHIRNKTTGRLRKGTPDKDGYLRLSINKKNRCIHILVARTFLENPEDKKCIDHINGNVNDNRLVNLRYATFVENAQNKAIAKNNTSGCKGVHYCIANKNWRSRISIDGIRISLGSFSTLEEAKEARVTRAKQAFGVFINDCEKKN